ncbi:MAG: group II truncated hemoglobin [Gammaproteobacteria bacterium]|nr:group II truncated hemoglobin [Gammaproteobacteria bacterium]
MVSSLPATPQPSLYERIGEEAALRRIVDRFYDLMESDPAVAPLRAMHAADLGPMRERLREFMMGWLGGPPVYFQRKNARCMAMVHAPFPIDAAMREQWLSCMHRALDDCGVSADLQASIRKALARMTEDMVNR